MTSAALYIMACSARNRVRRRLARLREPRYLFGALVGLAYFYFAIFGRFLMRSRRGRRPTPAAVFPAAMASGPVIGGAMLIGLAAISWVVPFGSALLQFSRAEVEFLLPAPLTRRQIVLYRLLRSQLAVFLGALIFAVVYPIATTGARVRGLIAVWLLLIASGVYFTGITLWRARPRDASWMMRALQTVPVVWTASGFALVVIGVVRTIWARSIERVDDAVDVIADLGSSGVLQYILWPFVALVRPLFTDSWTSFGLAFAPAFGVYLAVIGWALLCADGVDVIAERVVEQQQRATPSSQGRVYKARAVAWTLTPHGRPAGALVWKSALQMFRLIDRRTLLRVAMLLVWSAVAVSLVGRARGFAQALGFLSMMAAGFSVVFGPQILRSDLREDLQHLELLKTWPLRPAEIVRGEIVWPALAVATFAWLFGLVGLILSRSAFPSASAAWIASASLAFFVMTPALIAAQYTVHNGAALFFPAWIALGRSRARGIDAMGQRLIMLFGTWLVMLVGLLPSAVITAILWFAFFRFIGPWVLVPGAIIGAAVVLAEVLAATEALGLAYERLDITSVERAE